MHKRKCGDKLHVQEPHGGFELQTAGGCFRRGIWEDTQSCTQPACGGRPGRRLPGQRKVLCGAVRKGRARNRGSWRLVSKSHGGELGQVGRARAWGLVWTALSLCQGKPLKAVKPGMTLRLFPGKTRPMLCGVWWEQHQRAVETRGAARGQRYLRGRIPSPPGHSGLHRAPEQPCPPPGVPAVPPPSRESCQGGSSREVWGAGAVEIVPFFFN